MADADKEPRYCDVVATANDGTQIALSGPCSTPEQRAKLTQNSVAAMGDRAVGASTLYDPGEKKLPAAMEEALGVQSKYRPPKTEMSFAPAEMIVPRKPNPPKKAEPPRAKETPPKVVPPEVIIKVEVEPKAPTPDMDDKRPKTEVAFDAKKPKTKEEIAEQIVVNGEGQSDQAVKDADRAVKNIPPDGESHPTHSGENAKIGSGDADPVDLFSGTFSLQVKDLEIPTTEMPLFFERSYKSGRPYFGPFGYGWDHNHNVFLRPLKNGKIALWDGYLHEETYTLLDGTYTSEPGVHKYLEKLPDDQISNWTIQHCLRNKKNKTILEVSGSLSDIYLVQLPYGKTCIFGRPMNWLNGEKIPLVATIDNFGNWICYLYTDNHLARIVDRYDRGFQFFYGSCDLLERVEDTCGRKVIYEHHPQIELLVQVVLPSTKRYPEGVTTQYEYDWQNSHPSFRANILSILDADGRCYLENTYIEDSSQWSWNRVASQILGGWEYQFEYTQICWYPPDSERINVPFSNTLRQNPDGSFQSYQFNYRGDLLETSIELRKDGSLRTAKWNYDYDLEGNRTLEMLPDGRQILSTYDWENEDFLARGNILKVESIASPLYGMQSRIEREVQYDPDYQFVSAEEIRGQKRIKYSYVGGVLVTASELTKAGNGQFIELRKTLYEFYDSGLLKKEVREDGSSSFYEYNDLGLVIKKINSDSSAVQVFSYGYDELGFQNREISPDGVGKYARVNALGWVEELWVNTIDGKDGRRFFEHDGEGRILKTLYPRGERQGVVGDSDLIEDLFERDVQGNLVSRTVGANTEHPAVTNIVYDFDGQISEILDPLGKRIRYLYDERRLPITWEISNSSGEKTIHKKFYDLGGRPYIEKTGERVIESEFDQWGRLKTQSLPTGLVQKYSYDILDRIISQKAVQTSENSTEQKVFRFQTTDYQDVDRKVISKTAVFDPENSVLGSYRWIESTSIFDKMDRLTTVENQRGAKVQFEYDGLGRIKKKTDPIGNTVDFQYDDVARTVTQIQSIIGVGDDSQKFTRIDIADSRGRQVRKVLSDGRLSEFFYDDSDQVIRVKNQPGTDVQFFRNGLGHIIEERSDSLGLNIKKTYERDIFGNVTKFVSSDGEVVNHFYNADGMISKITAAYCGDQEWRYNQYGECVFNLRTNGTAVNISRNPKNGLVNRIDFATTSTMEPIESLEYFYDSYGQLKKLSQGGNAIEWSYDSLGRMVSESWQARKTDFLFDDFLNEVSVSYPYTQASDKYSATTHFDELLRPISHSLIEPSSSLPKVLLNWDYPLAARYFTKIFSCGVTARYELDEKLRLSGVTFKNAERTLVGKERYFDDKANLVYEQKLLQSATTQKFTFDSVDRIKSIQEDTQLPWLNEQNDLNFSARFSAIQSAFAPSRSESFDLNGGDVRTTENENGVSSSYTYESGYRLKEKGRAHYKYDGRGARREDFDKIYHWDALGRLKKVIKKSTNQIIFESEFDPLGRPCKVTVNGQIFQRWFIGNRWVLETDSGGQETRLILDPQTNMPFFESSGSSQRFNLMDVDHSTMAHADQNGALTGFVDFDGFGVVGPGTTPLPLMDKTPIRFFRGMQWKEDIALFETAFRFYDPSIGQFISPDPLLYIDSASSYAFVGHNPLSYFDPTGLAKQNGPGGAGHGDGPPLQQNSQQKGFWSSAFGNAREALGKVVDGAVDGLERGVANSDFLENHMQAQRNAGALFYGFTNSFVPGFILNGTLNLTGSLDAIDPDSDYATVGGLVGDAVGSVIMPGLAAAKKGGALIKGAKAVVQISEKVSGVGTKLASKAAGAVGALGTKAAGAAGALGATAAQVAGKIKDKVFYHGHHILPQELEELFEAINLDVHDYVYKVRADIHLLAHAKGYNKQIEEAFDRLIDEFDLPEADVLLDKGSKLAKDVQEQVEARLFEMVGEILQGHGIDPKKMVHDPDWYARNRRH